MAQWRGSASRLGTINRQMSAPAGFMLLRARVLMPPDVEEWR